MTTDDQTTTGDNQTDKVREHLDNMKRTLEGTYGRSEGATADTRDKGARRTRVQGDYVPVDRWHPREGGAGRPVVQPADNPGLVRVILGRGLHAYMMAGPEADKVNARGMARVILGRRALMP